MKISNIEFKNPIVLASMSGITNAKYAAENAYCCGLVILGSYNIDEESINAGLKSVNEGRSEFVYENDIIDHILKEIDDFKKLCNTLPYFKKEEMYPKIGISVRCKSIDKIVEIANILSKENIILELDCHCRQKPYLEAGLGENMIKDKKSLTNMINRIKETRVIFSIKIRANAVDWDDFLPFIKDIDVDIIHVDTMIENSECGDENYIKLIKNTIPNKIIIGNNGIKSLEDGMKYFSNGADMISIARASVDKKIMRDIVMNFNNHIKDNGWYNAPNHICKKGDLRGLAFCCPPIKNCYLLSTLKKLNILPIEYENLKIKYSKDTELQYNTNTCFGSLLWCCKITKPCFYRDQALKEIGLSKEKYMKLKKELGDNILLELLSYKKNPVKNIK